MSQSLRRITLFGTMFVAACAGSPSTSRVDPALANAPSDAFHRPSPGASSSWTSLYVANNDGNDVTVYANGKTKLTRTIKDGVSTPSALAFDSSGNLFVANVGCSPNSCNPYTSSITEYAAGSSSAMETISQGIAYPYAIAIDGKNDLWVANGGTNAVTEYAPGSQAPSLTLTHGVSQPMALTFDSAGNLYVANCNQCITPSAPDTVTVYSPSGKLLRTISEDITSPKSLAVDPYKTLLVANYSTLYVSYYKNGKAKLSGKITDDIANPTALIVDSEGNVYVASQNSIIAIFSPKTFALEAKIGQGLDQPGGLALSPSNDIYAANVAGNSVTGYSWSGSSSKLLYTITKGIKVPSAVAFGP